MSVITETTLVQLNVTINGQKKRMMFLLIKKHFNATRGHIAVVHGKCFRKMIWGVTLPSHPVDYFPITTHHRVFSALSTTPI